MRNNRLGREEKRRAGAEEEKRRAGAEEEKRRAGADMCTESTAVRIILISALIIIIRTTPPTRGKQ